VAYRWVFINILINSYKRLFFNGISLLTKTIKNNL
jgi:hypothetical protein